MKIALPHRAENLFELVAGIERYPEFIRWVRSMRVSEKSTDGQITKCIGRAEVGFSRFRETFATRVLADEDEKTIKVALVDGPLRHLNNGWRFEPKPDGTTLVHFDVDFEFRNVILRALASANFQLAANRIMDAFIAEADRRYEKVAQT